MTDAPDLEPAALEACPFCDGEPQLIDGGPGNFYVRCVQCNATGDDGSRDYALSRWNRRAARSAPGAGKAVVKPLDLSNLLRHAFMFGFETMGGTAEAAKDWWPVYNPEECPAFERILSALASSSAPTGAEPVAWRPTHRHKKRGSTYRVIAQGRLQVDADLDNEKVVVYRGEDGQVWVRPTYEFNDGRFETLTAAPLPEDTHHG